MSKQQSEQLSLQEALTILGLDESCTLTDVGNSFQYGFDQYTGNMTGDTVSSQQKKLSWRQVIAAKNVVERFVRNGSDISWDIYEKDQIQGLSEIDVEEKRHVQESFNLSGFFSLNDLETAVDNMIHELDKEIRERPINMARERYRQYLDKLSWDYWVLKEIHEDSRSIGLDFIGLSMDASKNEIRNRLSEVSSELYQNMQDPKYAGDKKIEEEYLKFEGIRRVLMNPSNTYF